jgi:threonylcarbamoyladenosine tRNA methylthiotransferase MtaB
MLLRPLSPLVPHFPSPEGHRLKYAVVTFGCRVNQSDSLSVEQDFRTHGAVATDADEADLVVVNTCSVTASADQAARQTIRRIARVNPAARIVVTGCYASRCPEEISALPHVSHVVHNDEKPRLISLVRSVGPAAVAGGPGLVERLPPDSTTAHRYGDGDGACGDTLEPGAAGRTAFTLRVQTGCAEQCSYCIIPTTRGRPRSVPIQDVLRELNRVATAGFKEVVLTGVHLGSYGRDLDTRSSLIELLRRLTEWCVGRSSDRPQADVLVRISSLEPMDCTPELVDLVATAKCLAPHFHLPLQHASNRVLMRMQRPYTFEHYRALVENIRLRIPHASIGSDIIVGFPGETHDEFGELCAYLESAPLTHLHVFPYSDRPGTLATGYGDKVHGAIVRDRGREVRDIGHRLAMAFRESQVGTMHRGLTLEDGSLVVTANYLKVKIPPGCGRNEWVTVRITASNEGGLTGELG